MGLDTTHGAWSGPYSAFYRWRNHVADAAGWHRVPDRDPPYETFVEINWDAITADNLEGRWETLPEDPLVVLMAHSDSSGELPVDVLLPLADRLDQIARHMSNSEAVEGGPYERGLYDGQREATVRFAAALREAAARREPVEFH